LESGLRLDTICQTAGIIEIACEPPPPGYWGPQPFKEFLLRIAAAKNSPATVSAERLGHWLRRISGRIVSVTDAQGVQRKYRLIREQGRSHRTGFKLVEI
jgi:hypothetical protein